jgi:dihydrodipicolinate synthase/N-acetylneuraminate lyase
MSWTTAEDIVRRSKDIQMVDELLSYQVPAIQYVTGFKGDRHSIQHDERKTVIEDVTDVPFVEEPFNY